LAAVVEASEVIGSDGESPFDADGCESTPSKATHPALLFQDPEHRFEQRLAASAQGAPRRRTQPLAAFAQAWTPSLLPLIHGAYQRASGKLNRRYLSGT
jgi:hypothetical protein